MEEMSTIIVIYLYFTSLGFACLAILAVLDERKVEVMMSVWFDYLSSSKLLVTCLIVDESRFELFKAIAANF